MKRRKDKLKCQSRQRSSIKENIWHSPVMQEADSFLVFDRIQQRRHRNRAASSFADHDALLKDTALQLIERVHDIKRPFHSVLDLGAHNGGLTQTLSAKKRFIVATDSAEKMVQTFYASSQPSVVCDEEYLPFADNSFDLIVSNLSLHWVNDLPGTLIQIKRALCPGGLFLATLLGGDTLQELRVCLMDAELSVMGGASPRLSPMISLQTASALLQRAGFEIPVVDQETYTLLYKDAWTLMHDLRGMGQTNVHHHRVRHPTRRAVFDEAVRLYQERFGQPTEGIPARFDVLFLHGWKP